jgi:hypothetical protein
MYKDAKLKDFIKVYDIIPQKDAEKILKEVKNIPYERHNFYSERTRTYKQHEIEPMRSGETIPSHEMLMDYMWQAAEQYAVKDLASDFWNGWNGFSRPKYNKYIEGEEMAFHCDHIHDLFDGIIRGIPVLSMIASFNDDYEGGELVINGESIKLKQGQIIIFPSVFLFPHKVATVTKGERYTAVCWTW